MLSNVALSFANISSTASSNASRASTQRSGGPQAVSVLTRTTVSLEYAALRHHLHCPLGMYIVPSVEDLLVWNAVFFVHQGYYAGAILKFCIVFPPTYPDKPPEVQLATDVFHPLIDNVTGAFSMSPRFKPWRPHEHRIFHVLHYIKAAFKKNALDEIQEMDCLNKEAFRYHNATSSFAALATQTCKLSNSSSAIFNDDHPSMTTKASDGIKFKELTPTQLQQCRSALGLSEWAENS